MKNITIQQLENNTAFSAFNEHFDELQFEMTQIIDEMFDCPIDELDEEQLEMLEEFAESMDNLSGFVLLQLLDEYL